WLHIVRLFRGNWSERYHRPYEAGSNPNTRSSWWQRQAFAMRAAHAIASSREGSSSTVKPPLSGGAHEYPPAENVPSAETSTGGTASSIPPPKTYTPAAFAPSITACESRPTAFNSLSGTTIAALGNEIKYFAIEFFLSEWKTVVREVLCGTTQAQRPGPQDAWIATAMRWPGSLQRMGSLQRRLGAVVIRG